MSDKTITRAHLSEAVYQEVGLSRNESAELVEAVLDLVADAGIIDRPRRARVPDSPQGWRMVGNRRPKRGR